MTPPKHRRPPHTHHIPFTAPITPQGHCNCDADDTTRCVIYETAKVTTASLPRRHKPKVKHIGIQTQIFTTAELSSIARAVGHGQQQLAQDMSQTTPEHHQPTPHNHKPNAERQRQSFCGGQHGPHGRARGKANNKLRAVASSTADCKKPAHHTTTIMNRQNRGNRTIDGVNSNKTKASAGREWRGINTRRHHTIHDARTRVRSISARRAKR